MALLQRDLRFKLLAVFDGARGVLTALSMVLLAWLGFRYWTLVIGNLLGTLVLTGLILSWRRHSFALPRLTTLKRPLGFSQHIITGRLAWYWYTTADFLVAGRMLGKASLGAYTIAWDLANMIIAKVTDMVSRVTPSFFAAVQDDRAALRRYFLSLTEGIALLTFPVTIGLALVADDFVRVVLGDKWILAIVPLQILAVYAAFRSITPLVSQVLQVAGEERFEKWNTVAAGLILPIGFVAGAKWGGAGIAAVWLFLHPPILAWAFRRAFSVLDLPPSQYLRALWPALSGAVVIAASVLGAKRVFLFEWPPAASLAAQITIGAVAYVATLLVFHRDRIQVFQGVVRALRR